MTQKFNKTKRIAYSLMPVLQKSQFRPQCILVKCTPAIFLVNLRPQLHDTGLLYVSDCPDQSDTKTIPFTFWLHDTGFEIEMKFNNKKSRVSRVVFKARKYLVPTSDCLYVLKTFKSVTFALQIGHFVALVYNNFIH